MDDIHAYGQLLRVDVHHQELLEPVNQVRINPENIHSTQSPIKSFSRF